MRAKSTDPQRLQRMNTDMYHSSWNYVSGKWRNRICGMLLSLGFVGLSYGVHGQSPSKAPQAPLDQNEGTSTIYRDPSSGLDQPKTEMQEQETDTSQEDQPVPESDQTEVTQSMSAEQIIGILQQEPDALQSIKEQVALQSRADPKSITNDALFARIRQNETVRTLATQELISRGYSANQTVTPPPVTGTSATGTSATGTPATGTPASPGKSPSGRQRGRAGRVADQPYESPDHPQVQRRVSPYPNLPSLSDLYTQFPPAQPKLHRFGSDALLIGSGNANQLPLDLPAGPEYVLGPGDTLMLNLWGSRTDRLSRTIDRQGQVELPEAGAIMVSGMTIAQAQVAMEKVLNMQFQKEHVEISLGRVRTVRVYVVGDVQRPGAYDVSSLSSPLSALYEAGGPTSRGSLRILRQYRGKQLVRETDLYDFLLRGVRDNDVRLLPGDTLLVPPAGPQVSIEGTVHRPAIYELNGEQGLDQVLELAGGVLASASLKQIKVERIEAHESRSMFNLQLPDNPAELHDKLAAFKVKDGDDVIISQILPYNAQAVYLQGHVYRPGKFPYHDGMSAADLLHSYQDVLPEPSERAELIRLEAPDDRPVTISFNLRDVLVGNESILLRPFDVIRVFGRYEQDSPTVSIQGEVLRPGIYPMPQGMTVAGLLKLAGGFRRSAFREEADLSTYTIQNGQKVVINHSSISLEKALAGDQSADAALKPGDVVSVRRLAGWLDIGSSVTITGEVVHPGSYGITEGEHLSEVLRRAGGFTANAYPYAAVLERVRVREMGEQARQEMIKRIEDTPLPVRGASMATASTTVAQDSLEVQRQQILTSLRNRPAGGRLVIQISSDIKSWENTAADVEMRAGDTLVLPKRPDFVSVSGQVYNPVAINYSPGKKLDWYIRKAGGATQGANKSGMYVLRADGSVVPRRTGWLSGGNGAIRMRPGDTIFVPEKIMGGSMVWQNILSTAQIMSAAALPIALAASL
jgi:protein involved in polysaccharide export with SLBB domain